MDDGLLTVVGTPFEPPRDVCSQTPERPVDIHKRGLGMRLRPAGAGTEGGGACPRGLFGDGWGPTNWTAEFRNNG